MSTVPIADEDRAKADAARSDERQSNQFNALLVAVAIVSMTAFITLTAALLNHIVFPFDQPILTFFHGWDGTPALWNDVSQSANFPLIGIGLGLVVWLVWKHHYHEALIVVLLLVAVTAGSEGVKQLTARLRPSGSGDGIPGVVYSYPSGHVLESLTILGTVAIRFWRTSGRYLLRILLAIAVLIEVILVGIARMALNEHYPTDLLGGLFGAVAALCMYTWFTRRGGWAGEPASADD
jgi:membrane-associated phospholipid phosphatase